MATQFIGLHMRVVLRDPPGYQLEGTVRAVEAGSSLTLTGVRVPGIAEPMQHMIIDASNIVDLSEVANRYEQQTSTFAQPPAQPNPRPIYTQPPSKPSFVDPAIVSLGRRPNSSTPTSATPRPSALPPDGTSEYELRTGHAIGVPQNATAGGVSMTHTPVQEFPELQHLSVGNVTHELDSETVGEIPTPAKTRKKTRTKRQAKGVTVNTDMRENEKPTQNSGHGAGWRETPILQTNSFQPYKALKKNSQSRKNYAESGWASEDVTEDLPEFDFENNLAKFDKQTIFNQMRKDDQVDDDTRLVAHNRRPKPGTGGGKNLHYTENVLEVPVNAAQSADYWNSEADVGHEDGERLSGRELRGQGMKRTESKSGVGRRSQSRKASGLVGGHPLSRVNSSQTHPPQITKGHQAGLYIHPSGRRLERLETISALQMLNLENIAANELLFTEDLMAENAGRGIAEVAVAALDDPATKARYELAVASSPTDTTMNPTNLVILGGNNKSTMRSLAAGRHLRNKGYKVTICLVGIERERELLEELRRQIQLYRNFGGKVLSKNDFFDHLRKGSASGKQAWVSLIIDSLLGLTMSFEELRVGDQATVYELMEWANRNDAYSLAVDIPSGIDAATGKIAIIDGSHLFVKPRYVVSIGAPKHGLLEAVQPPSDGESGPSGTAAHEDEWRLFVADLGLGNAVWKKAGTKIRRGVDFAGKWVLEMRYRGDEEEEEDDD